MLLASTAYTVAYAVGFFLVLVILLFIVTCWVVVWWRDKQARRELEEKLRRERKDHLSLRRYIEEAFERSLKERRK